MNTGDSRHNPFAGLPDLRKLNKYDIALRPEGCERLRTETTFSDLQVLILLLAQIDRGEPVDVDTLACCRAALAKLSSSARTVYRGRHPRDITTAYLGVDIAPGAEAPVLPLPVALKQLRSFAEKEFQMTGAFTPHPRRIG